MKAVAQGFFAGPRVRFGLLAGALALAAPLAVADVAVPVPAGAAREGWVQRQRARFQNRNLLDRAQEALSAKRYTEAEPLLRRALQNDPHNNYVKVSLINVYNHLERWDEGVFLCDALIQSYPDYTDAYFYKAYMAMRAGRDELAIETFEALLAKTPGSLQAIPPEYKELAEVYFKGGAFVERQAEVFRSLAELCLRQGELARAERYARDWNRVEDTLTSRLFLAETAIRREAWPAALAALDRALVQTGDDESRGRVELKRGHVLMQLGRIDAAEEAFRTAGAALTQEPEKSQIVAQLTQISLRKGYDAYAAGDWPAADAAFTAALPGITDPALRRSVQRQSAEVALQVGDAVRAADLLYELLEQRYDEEVALATLEACARAGQHERGVKVARAVLDQPESNRETRRRAMEYLVRFYDKLGADDQYYATAKALLDEYPDERAYLLETALAAKRATRIDESLEFYALYLDRGFDARVALDYYYLLKVTGDAEAAAVWLERVATSDAAAPDVRFAARYEKAQVLRAAGDAEGYLALMAELVKDRPEADLLFEYGVQLYGHGHLDRSAQIFEESLRLQGDVAKRFATCKVLANVHLSRNAPETADAWLETALAHGKPDLEWTVTRARAWYALQRFDDVVDLLWDADATSDDVNLLTGFSHYRMGRAGLALHHFRAVREPERLRHEERITYHANRAHLHFAQSQHEAALDDAGGAIALRFSPRLALLGMKSLIELGRYAEARDTALALRELFETDVEELPLRADFAKTLGRAYFALEENEHAIQAYDEAELLLQDELANLPADAEERKAAYRDWFASIREVFYLRGLARTRLQRYDDAHRDFEPLVADGEHSVTQMLATAAVDTNDTALVEVLAALPGPDGVFWGDYAALQGHRRDFERGIAATERSLALYPYDIDTLEEASYQFMKWKKNDESQAAMVRAVEVFELVQPYLAPEDVESYTDDATFLKREYAKLERSWGANAYVYRTEFGDDELADALAGVSTVEGVLASQLGVELNWQPPVLGFREERIFNAFVRFLANFERDSWTPDEDTYQLGVGVRYKPFKRLNFSTGIERLIAIGDAAEDNWLWRNAYALEFGEKPKKSWEWWMAGRGYAEASYFIEEPTRWVYFVDLKGGVTLNMADIALLTLPQAKLIYRHQTDDPTGVGSYIYYGLGFELRILEREKEKLTERWYMDLFAHYVIGSFTDEPVQVKDKNRDFEGVIFGVNFVK